MILCASSVEFKLCIAKATELLRFATLILLVALQKLSVLNLFVAILARYLRILTCKVNVFCFLIFFNVLPAAVRAQNYFFRAKNVNVLDQIRVC